MAAKNIAILLQSDEIKLSNQPVEINRIAPNSSSALLRFSFQVPRTLEKKAVNIKLQLTQKDFSGLTDQIKLPIRLVLPQLEITHQLRDSNKNGKIEQGESIALVVKLKNTGKLDAENVVLSLKTGQYGAIQKGVVLNNSTPQQVMIRRIAANSESEAQKFLIEVQRRADIGNLPLHFTVTQKDFKSQSFLLNFNIAKETVEEIIVEP